jgi:RND family efflux transporter MFP subunit
MSDRMLIAAACVPMLGGLVLLVLLARVPAKALNASETTDTKAASAQSIPAASPRNWIGVVVPANTAELAASDPGRVEKVFVRTGATVKPGTPLLQFDRSESSSSANMAHAQLSERASELSRSQARSDAASKRLRRLQSAATWLSKQELDNATAEASVADAELRAARANMGVSRIALKQQRMRVTRQTLTAPFAGTVISLGVDVGDSVSAGQVVMRILSEELQVRFAFPPGELAALHDRRVALQLEGSEHRVVAQVSAVRPEVDPSAQLVFAMAPLPASLPQAVRWIPGAPVAVTPIDP